MLGTFNQAMEALGNADGLQVHRSWWVARKAVVRAIIECRNPRLQLVNGITAPVARSAVATVREAGWLTNENPSEGPGTGYEGARVCSGSTSEVSSPLIAHDALEPRRVDLAAAGARCHNVPVVECTPAD